MATKRKTPDPKSETMREGEWFCARCHVKNYSARITCFKCGITKTQSELQTKGKSALDWSCYKCKANNFSRRDTCFKCSISRFESDDMRAFREGVPWVCRFCELENRAGNSVCFKCKRDKHVADAAPPRRPPSPPRRPHSPPPRGLMGPGRLLPRPPSRPVSPLNKLPPYDGNNRAYREPDWQCTLCGTRNAPERCDCYKCTTVRGETGPRPQRKSESRNINDGGGTWRCPECDYANYNADSECRNCKPADPMSLSITINNSDQDSHQLHGNSGPGVSLNHSMQSRSTDQSPAKRRRMDDDQYGPSPSTRRTWGPDWICGHCEVDVFPTRSDCYKCGRHRDECELRGESSRQPNMYVDPRDRGRGYGDFRREEFHQDGYTCVCGNFNRMTEPCCVKCGRQGDGGGRLGEWGGPPPLENRGNYYRDDRRGRRSPPRYYHDAPRRNDKIVQARKAAALSQNAKKAEAPRKKKANDWICKECPGPVTNYNGREKCFKCKKDRSEVDGGFKNKEGVKIKGKPLEDVFNGYLELFEALQADKERKLVEGDVDVKALFKVRRIALRRLEKAQRQKSTDDIEKYTKLYESMTVIHDKAHEDLIGDLGWWCKAGECDGYNYPHRTTCYKCKAEKPADEGTDQAKGDPIIETQESDIKDDLEVKDEQNIGNEEVVKEDEIGSIEQPVDFESDY